MIIAALRTVRYLNHNTCMRFILFSIFLLGQYVLSLPGMGQVMINEFMADNQNVIADPDFGKYCDWIELYNSSSGSIDISGYALTDDPDLINKWLFPSGSVIPASGYLLIWADNEDTGLHTNFKLGKSGETLILSDKSLALVDSYSYSEQIEDVSFGRISDGAGEWAFFTSSTPGAQNSAGNGDLMAGKPVFSLGSGFYNGPQQITLQAQSGTARIFYTLDGSDPTRLSAVYTQPININQTTAFRAIQIDDGFLDSPITTKTYFIDEETVLPVFSIVTDPPNLWDLDSGIYVEGRDYVWDWGAGNFWQDWERQAFVEFWESDRDLKISQGVGIKITGALTRTASQKSLRLIARSEYGAKKLSYRFFKDKSITDFNDIVLRSSGNDWARTMFADGLMATIVSGQMDIDYNAYRPAVVFLNGEYWGIHNIREKVGDDYIEENHGFDKNNLDLLSQLDDMREGDRENYDALLNFVQNNDLNTPENYAYLEKNIDLQEYLNYYVTQTFYANNDWPAGNIKYWRPRQEVGQWRWILFDTDLAYQTFWINTMELITDSQPFYEGTNDFFLGLMTCEKIKERFLSTYQYLLATTFQKDRLVNIVDSLQAAIQPEMKRHIDRWKGYHGWTFTTADGTYLETPWLESYSAWLSYVDEFRLFSLNRADYLNQFVAQYYGYGNDVEVSISIDPYESGKVWVNEDKATSSFMNLVFFEDQPVTLRPVNSINTIFQEWKVETGFSDVNGRAFIFPKESEWKYLDNDQYPGNSWTDEFFDDSQWKSGQGALGYNYPGANTIVEYGPDAANKYITYWFRKQFRIDKASDWSNLQIELLRDDGAIVWLNGQEIIRSNMAAGSDYRSTAETGVDASDESRYFLYELSSNLLKDGQNTISVEIHQISKTSSDLGFDLALSGITNQEVGEITTVTDALISKSFVEKTKYTASFARSTESVLVKINEVMSDNQTTLTTEYGKTPDWIEIFNPNEFDIDLGGLYITDNLLVPDKFQISTQNPEMTTVPAKGFKLFIADGSRLFNAKYVDIQLSTRGEEVGLYEKVDGGFNLIDSLIFPPLMPDASFGRYPDGEDAWFLFSQLPTPGATNKRSDQIIPDRQVVLLQNYPNPFKDATNIMFNLKDEVHIRIEILDLLGHPVRQVTNRTWGPGLHTIEWNAKNDFGANVQPGVYLIVLYSGFYSQTNKMILLR